VVGPRKVRIDEEVINGDITVTEVIMRKSNMKRPDLLWYELWVKIRGHREEIRLAIFMRPSDLKINARRISTNHDVPIRSFLP